MFLPLHYLSQYYQNHCGKGEKRNEFAFLEKRKEFAFLEKRKVREEFCIYFGLVHIWEYTHKLSVHQCYFVHYDCQCPKYRLDLTSLHSSNLSSSLALHHHMEKRLVIFLEADAFHKASLNKVSLFHYFEEKPLMCIVVLCVRILRLNAFRGMKGRCSMAASALSRIESQSVMSGRGLKHKPCFGVELSFLTDLEKGLPLLIALLLFRLVLEELHTLVPGMQTKFPPLILGKSTVLSSWSGNFSA